MSVVYIGITKFLAVIEISYALSFSWNITFLLLPRLSKIVKLVEIESVKALHQYTGRLRAVRLLLKIFRLEGNIPF